MRFDDPDLTAPTPAFTPSAQQQAIYDWFRSGTGHLVVEALAGTGKTTTILEAVKYAPEDRIALVAFNKIIAEELSSRLTNPNAVAMTLHSLGFRLVKRFWGGVRVDSSQGRKYDLARTALVAAGYSEAQQPHAIVKTVANLHTQAREMIPNALMEDMLDLMVAFDHIPDPEWVKEGWTMELLADLALRAMTLAASAKPAKGIDFADMLFLPLRNRWLVPMFDLIVVDERQDMNRAQLDMAQGVLAEGGRLVLVGDEHQAIYGFRGADTKSSQRLKEQLNPTLLPLTRTYRCGKAIVERARQQVPEFEAAEANPEGQVMEASQAQMLKDIRPGDFLLSRINAPLVSVALALVRQGVRVQIRGKDFGKGLQLLAEKLAEGKATNSIPEWLGKLSAWEEREIDRATKAKMEGKVDQIIDKALTLRVLSDGVTGVPELLRRIESLFSDAPQYGATVVCSSIHKAKGLEADTVWVLADTLNLPVTCTTCRKRGSRCKCAGGGQPDKARLQEESNLVYVAVTRAKARLVLVRGEVEEAVEGRR